jgi:hypothetical protein
MNKLIRQLKAQAGIDYNPDQEGLNIFVELIVNECVNNMEYSPEWVKQKIKKHFGIN